MDFTDRGRFLWRYLDYIASARPSSRSLAKDRNGRGGRVDHVTLTFALFLPPPLFFFPPFLIAGVASADRLAATGFRKKREASCTNCRWGLFFSSFIIFQSGKAGAGKKKKGGGRVRPALYLAQISQKVLLLIAFGLSERFLRRGVVCTSRVGPHEVQVKAVLYWKAGESNFNALHSTPSLLKL